MRNIEEMRKQLGFTNDFIFCTVMEENPDLCKQLVEKITGRTVKQIEMIQHQQLSVQQLELRFQSTETEQLHHFAEQLTALKH